MKATFEIAEPSTVYINVTGNSINYTIVPLKKKEEIKELTSELIEFS